jgi:hypothetical protein
MMCVSGEINNHAGQVEIRAAAEMKKNVAERIGGIRASDLVALFLIMKLSRSINRGVRKGEIDTYTHTHIFSLFLSLDPCQ